MKIYSSVVGGTFPSSYFWLLSQAKKAPTGAVSLSSFSGNYILRLALGENGRRHVNDSTGDRPA